MHSSFLFRTANVLAYISKKVKKKITPAANVTCGGVCQVCQFYSSQDVIVKKGRLQEGMIHRVTVLCWPLSSFFMLLSRCSNFTLSNEKVKTHFPHASGRRLWTLFFAAFVLWIHVYQRFVRPDLKDLVFCTSCSGTWCAGISLNDVTKISLCMMKYSLTITILKRE